VDAARSLEVDPLEMVRLLVIAGDVPEVLELSDSQIETARTAGALESWWDDYALPEDDDERRAAVRGAVRQLLDRGCVGDGSTRMDNIWRGLQGAQRDAVEAAANAMVDGELATSSADRSGLRFSVNPDAVASLEQLAAGSAVPDVIAEVLGG
jgi:hypothetical protein